MKYKILLFVFFGMAGSAVIFLQKHRKHLNGINFQEWQVNWRMLKYNLFWFSPYISEKPRSVALTLSEHSRVMGPAHRLTERNVWVKLMKIVQRIQEIWKGHEIEG